MEEEEVFEARGNSPPLGAGGGAAEAEKDGAEGPVGIAGGGGAAAAAEDGIGGTDGQGAEESLYPLDAAFEVFAGRVFHTDAAAAAAGEGSGRQRMGKQSVMESPMERFARLRSEVEQLREDLQAMDLEEDGGAVGQGGAAVWKWLQRETDGLKEQLQDLETHKTRAMREEAPVTTGPGDKTEEVETGTAVAAEAEATESKEQSNDMARMLRLERRIHALEASVGGLDAGDGVLERGVLLGAAQTADGRAGAARPLPLAQAVARMERQVRLLDEGTIQAVEQRARALLTEMQAVLTPSNGSGSGAGASGPGGDSAKQRKKRSGADAPTAVDAEHLARVRWLHDQLQEYEGVSQALPQLLARLRSLQQLHVEAASFNTRLAGVEAGSNNLREELASVTTALQALETGLAENMTTIQANVAALEARLQPAPFSS